VVAHDATLPTSILEEVEVRRTTAIYRVRPPKIGERGSIRSDESQFEPQVAIVSTHVMYATTAPARAPGRIGYVLEQTITNLWGCP